MMDISSFFIHQDRSVNEAMRQIDKTGKKIVFVVDAQQRLVGVFTDGDMRRYILYKGKLTDPVFKAMNPNPVKFNESEENLVEQYWKKNKLIAIPIVNRAGQVVKARFWNDEYIAGEARTLPKDMPLVIMAGGKGTRLYPYTKILPKPLIPIGDIPITEHIINRFVKYGISRVFLIVNHKRNMIKAYFNEVDKNYNLEYVDEEHFLGTGGGVSLLKGRIHHTFFVSNCDILIDADYECMYDYHKKQGNMMTIITAMKNIEIPYGVIETGQNGDIQRMVEKPEFSFLTNTGVYLMEPQVLDEMEEGVSISLPDVAQKLMDQGHNVGAYPVTEKSWMDMGQLEEMKEMMKAMGVE